MSTAHETRTNARIVSLTEARRRQAPGRIVAEPDPALVLRWIEYTLNDPYFLLCLYEGCKPSAFGTEVVAAARLDASTAQEPPRRA